MEAVGPFVAESGGGGAATFVFKVEAGEFFALFVVSGGDDFEVLRPPDDAGVGKVLPEVLAVQLGFAPGFGQGVLDVQEFEGGVAAADEFAIDGVVDHAIEARILRRGADHVFTDDEEGPTADPGPMRFGQGGYGRVVLAPGGVLVLQQIGKVGHEVALAGPKAAVDEPAEIMLLSDGPLQPVEDSSELELDARREHVVAHELLRTVIPAADPDDEIEGADVVGDGVGGV